MTEGREERQEVQPTGIGSPVGVGSRVMVVDDDLGVREVVSELIATEGYEVLQASGGAEALAMLEELGGHADLVLTDVRMPHMSGTELARRIRERFPEIRLMYMTGYAGAALSDAEVVDASIPLLRKPFSVDELLARVAEALRTPARALAH